jgi:hypothetical protein
VEARRSRSVRSRTKTEGSRQRLPSYLSGLLLAIAAAPAPPASVFMPGRNLCRTVSLAAIRAAGGQHYRPGIFAAGTCTWERADLAAGLTLTTHPRSAGLTLMRQFLTQPSLHAHRVRVPGAGEAVLARFSSRAAYLFAAYPAGVVQVNMTAPTAPSKARLVAVMRLVAPKG